MNEYLEKLDELKTCKGYWANRAISEIKYALKLSKVTKEDYSKIIKKTIDFLHDKKIEEGVITNKNAKHAEEMLLGISEEAKKYTLICAAHAHIDMNWMWGYPETAATVLDTFRTMLNIMDEYPSFKFSQSQASVYEIVEKYDQEMLEEIKKRIKEGRWEVSASTWVEADKNMPNGESHSRHILYTKKYLSKLLGISSDSMNIDFEPDTFGHSENVPEILSNGNVKYYYHCRGYEEHSIYKWEAPSGKSIIVYREPLGYSSAIDGSIALIVPEFCNKRKIKSMLRVYGVGDHGGGPTRRDVERLIDMNSWPVYPNIKLGTFGEFFETVNKVKDELPVVKKELNFVFSGCYTTQTRIKLSNRISESRMFNAESFSTFDSIFNKREYPTKLYAESWKNILFNQFHDILTGSGVIETREYSMGKFQEVLTAANAGYMKAIRNISSLIDTSLFESKDDVKEDGFISEGAGVGFEVSDYCIPQTERGSGKKRIFHFFNASSHGRKEVAQITLWDWPGEVDRIVFKDKNFQIIEHQIIKGKAQQLHPEGAFWGHKYIKLLLEVDVPSFGYNTYMLEERKLDDYEIDYPNFPRTEKEDEFILENEYIKVEFDKKNASIISLMDKEARKEYIDGNRPAGIFRLIEEDTSKGMTSWIIGRYMNIVDLNKDVKIKDVNMDRSILRQWISYEISFRESKLQVKISLDKKSKKLDFQVKCDWQEKAEKNVYIPQLNFYMPFSYQCKKYKYDVPFGLIERDEKDMDVPGNSFACAIDEADHNNSVVLITETKYGFRGYKNALSLSLIRSSYDPDPYPENGMHNFKFAVRISDSDNIKELVNEAFDYNHSISFVSGKTKKGKMPLCGNFLKINKGSSIISAIKKPEDSTESEMIIRLYNVTGSQDEIEIEFNNKIKDSWFVDGNEKRVDSESIEVEKNVIRFLIKPYSVNGICIKFDI